MTTVFDFFLTAGALAFLTYWACWVAIKIYRHFNPE